MKSVRGFRLRLALVGVLAFVGLALSVAGVLAAEHVVNGGFESGLDSWHFSGVGDYGVSVSGEVVHSGLASVVVTASAGSDFELGQDFDLVPGVVYTLSLWTYGVGEPLRVTYSDNDGVWCALVLPVLAEWSYSECVFTTTSGVNGGLLIGVADDVNGGAGYVDDVSVSDGVSVPTPTPVSASQWTVVTGTLPSGKVYAVEYRVTAGDIFVGVVAFIFLVIAVVMRKHDPGFLP